tara:strand:- start:214 stop:1113 length:900 start_codon:yes stop_codon:yes gene_type:complete
MNFIEQKNYDINSSDSKNFCIEENSNNFISKYYILINQYLAFLIENIYDNININNDKRYRYYIILKGLEMLTNIMQITIMNTNNIDIAFYYCNKGYYYYIEFISQIDNDNNHLELNIKDAIIFVYKKTIFEIKEPIGIINNCNVNNNNIKKVETIRKMMDIVNNYVKIFKIKDIINLNINNEIYINSQIYIDKSLLKIINKLENNYKDEQQFSILVQNLYNIFKILLKVFNKINIINSENYSIDDVLNFQLLINLIERLFIKICNCKQLIDFENIITYNSIKNLTNIKIRQIIATLNIE